VARELVAGFGPELVAACDVGPGQRVLDVAAGAGNVAIPAAEAGAEVVACDLTPELFEAGRREAAARGVEVEWVEADAEALPFGDGEFDVITSSLGAMFAPDHQRVADELVRVCRTGGTIGMVNWTPESLVGNLFGTMKPYAPPPPPGSKPPVLWGSEDHVRELFGDRVAALDMTRRSFVEDGLFADPVGLRDYFKAYYGPTIAVYKSLADEPERAAALDRDFAELAARWNRGAPDGAPVFDYEYLLIVARKPLAPTPGASYAVPPRP
jgi:SAM-dependent methyltransferase